MELVIKLDDETYKEVMDRTEFDTLNLGIKLIEAVQNGTQLKRHGRLIDAERYRNEMLTSREFDFFKTLDMQPTIIEADKGETE